MFQETIIFCMCFHNFGEIFLHDALRRIDTLSVLSQRMWRPPTPPPHRRDLNGISQTISKQSKQFGRTIGCVCVCVKRSENDEIKLPENSHREQQRVGAECVVFQVLYLSASVNSAGFVEDTYTHTYHI